MLESAVARLLNVLLGKYVIDLDTENLNVGIFSGRMQLTDLKLKPEALFELNLPIEVKVGTIGRIWLQIPWSSLWSSPVVITIEDVHIVSGPIISTIYNGDIFDEERNRRLLRSYKKQALSRINQDNNIIGGPQLFTDYLLTNIVNNLQLTVNNIHIKYEDSVSFTTPIVAGLCIGGITAEATNSKWKACNSTRNQETSYYIIKLEGLFIYWNPNLEMEVWQFPGKYYQWRNSMSITMKNFTVGGKKLEFLLKPITIKFKLTITKIPSTAISHVLHDVVIHDLNLQLTKDQCSSIAAVMDALQRSFIIWPFLSARPRLAIHRNSGKWWRYAYNCVLEQRVRPYSWSRIKKMRKCYKKYVDKYVTVMSAPNDTELKLDLQLLEDELNLINIVIGRQQARRLTNKDTSVEKGFWDILPSPERTILCKKIGFSEGVGKNFIDHKYNFRIGNISICLLNKQKEIFVLTMTQLISSYHPFPSEDRYVISLKIEALILEVINDEDYLVPILSSENNGHNRPAYFLKIDIEKRIDQKCIGPIHKISIVLEYVEITYEKLVRDHLELFLDQVIINKKYIVGTCECYKYKYLSRLKAKFWNKCDLVLDLKIPYVALPENGSITKGENIFVLDLGRLQLRSELCLNLHDLDGATQMELEEKLYSRYHMSFTGAQILFIANREGWRDSRNERDTAAHVLSKTDFSVTYAKCVEDNMKTLPKNKVNFTFPLVKFNFYERRLLTFLKYYQETFAILKVTNEIGKCDNNNMLKLDQVCAGYSIQYLSEVQKKLDVHKKDPNLGQIVVNNCKRNAKEQIRSSSFHIKENINEVWARCVDLPGLEDNISPSNTISTILQIALNEFQIIFYKSSDNSDRQYLVLRLGYFTMDLAWMTFGPALQITLNNILLTDKLHTTTSGQYLDLVYSCLPTKTDLVTILFRKVVASCPDFWSHFHGVETSLVADFGTIFLVLHQESVHTLIKYQRYFHDKVLLGVTDNIKHQLSNCRNYFKTIIEASIPEAPVPPGSIKFSQSARLSALNIRICDSDYEIVNLQLNEYEIDFLFRANERFIFRSFLSNLICDHLLDDTLYTKILSTDQDKVFEMKYVKLASNIVSKNQISPLTEDNSTNGSLKFQLGQLHVTFIYKLLVQLQRFITNLDAIQYLRSFAKYCCSKLSEASSSLKSTAKMNLAINVKGPALMFPQKSSSPNVIIIDTGDLIVENFFKDSGKQDIENILLKLSGITVSRGVMTLTNTIQLQETIIESVNCHVDIKRVFKASGDYLSWDIDGLIDHIVITLGQRDISTILAIFNENFGESNVSDLFPEQSILDNDEELQDDTVKSLEAFFGEPKQKTLAIKLFIEGLNLGFFFDSGELLSSPIRDLNHGLCKFEINAIAMSYIVYGDTSLDGKLTIETLFLQEIGPDANSIDQRILYLPIDQRTPTNSNITIVNPPIVDITFHKTQIQDKSVDIIIGRLCLCLSVPFCEKLFAFISECIPREPDSSGIINHGYIGDNVYSNRRSPTRGLTVAVRIIKPELIFRVESASNRNCYFKTKAEILSDYSVQRYNSSLTISLSGLFSTLHEDANSNCEPFLILRPCDVELSKNNAPDKGERINLIVSSVHLTMNSRVFHAITDIINDIAENFKSPSNIEVFEEPGPQELDDLWEQQPISNLCVPIDPTEEYHFKGPLPPEVFLLQKLECIFVFELDDKPVIILKSNFELAMYDWTSLLNCTGELAVQANYFNDENQSWEPLIDPVVIDENCYKPWDISLKVFQDRAFPLREEDSLKVSALKERKRIVAHSSTEEEDDSGEEMVYLKPATASHANHGNVTSSLPSFLDDSDSESEDGIAKLSTAISELFTSEPNESEGSGEEQSSEDEDLTPIKRNISEKSLDFSKKATFFLIDSREKLNLSVTPVLIRLINDLVTMYSSKSLSITRNGKINIINDIGPQSKVEFFENIINAEGLTNSTLITYKIFEKEESCPNSPEKGSYTTEPAEAKEEDDEESYDEEITKYTTDPMQQQINNFDSFECFEFPEISTAELHEKINKYHLAVHVKDFHSVQTNCPKRTFSKLIRMQSVIRNQIYYILVNHRINKYGWKLTLSSPLQIKNETCFAMGILYQPSILQQLNLEPVGDIMNPFETTMRIAVLEPREEYNIPIHVAYHCKLFVQPAYAEGHHASEKGIWWKDFVQDLDCIYNIQCAPKNTAISLDIFALRVKLERNTQPTISMPKLQLNQSTIPNYSIRLMPPITIHNNLPYIIEIEHPVLKQRLLIEPGETSSMYCINLNEDQMMVLYILCKHSKWWGQLNLTTHLDEKVLNLGEDGQGVDDKGRNQMNIHVKVDRSETVSVFLFSPYWIVNKTGLPIYLRASSTVNVFYSDSDDILLFSYKKYNKRSVNIRIYDSNWSSDFGLDSVGITGLIVCKDIERKKRYCVYLTVNFSHMCSKLSKVVNLLPQFVVENTTTRRIRFMEHNEKSDLWNDLLPNQCMAFWPDTQSMQMYVKYIDYKIVSQPFYFAMNHTTVLRMDKGRPITVEVIGGSHDSFRIIFRPYVPGDAPVIIKNMCQNLYLKIQQQGQDLVSLLSPLKSLIYTWDYPTKPKQLMWNVYNNKKSGFAIDVNIESFGEERISLHTNANLATPSNNLPFPQSLEDLPPVPSSSSSSETATTTTGAQAKESTNKRNIFWICCRVGPNRTLFFTEDQNIYRQLLRTYLVPLCNWEYVLAFAGLGISFFTDHGNKNKEHIALTANNKPAVWQVNVGHKWKLLSIELASWIESKYLQNSHKKCQLKDYIHIDFERMFMLKPVFAELRRDYNPAIYLQYRKAGDHSHINCKLHSVQIDNKKTSMERVILFQPIFNNNAEKPKINSAKDSMLEFDVLVDNLGGIKIYKNIQFVISDLYVQVQSGAITAIEETISKNWKNYSEDKAVLYRKDMADIRSLVGKPKMCKSNWNIIEQIDVGGFAVFFNISNKGSSLYRILTKNPLILDFLFPINAAPYLPRDALKHTISPLHYSISMKTTNISIVKIISKHIQCQFLQQYYSQMLGLQILMNPHVNSSDISIKKSNDAIISKYHDKIIFGCRCLLGHINMSCAALEHSILEIFLNQTADNIHRIQRTNVQYDSITASPTINTHLARSFNPGVIIAVNQLIIRNSNGKFDETSTINYQVFQRTRNYQVFQTILHIYSEIFAGFHYDVDESFRGPEKSILSQIMRYTDIKMNCVSLAIEALQRAADSGIPIKLHNRLTRYYNNYLGLKPMSVVLSMGQHVMETIGNGRFSNDQFWGFGANDKTGNTLIIVTVEHIVRVNKCRLWGQWEMEWWLELDDILSVPKVQGCELILNVRQVEHDINSSENKIIIQGDKKMLMYLQQKIEQAIIVSMEDKFWIPNITI